MNGILLNQTGSTSDIADKLDNKVDKISTDNSGTNWIISAIKAINTKASNLSWSDIQSDIISENIIGSTTANIFTPESSNVDWPATIGMVMNDDDPGRISLVATILNDEEPKYDESAADEFRNRFLQLRLSNKSPILSYRTAQRYNTNSWSNWQQITLDNENIDCGTY